MANKVKEPKTKGEAEALYKALTKANNAVTSKPKKSKK